jgi:hypothetical protein
MKATTFSLTVDDKQVEFEIKQPSIKDTQEADKFYRKMVNHLVNPVKPEDGRCLLRLELQDFAKTRGLWNDDKTAELESLEREIARIESICATGIDPDNKERVKLSHAKELAKNCREELRPKLSRLRKVLYDLDELTAEGQAEAEKYKYLLAASVFYKEGGKKVFASYEDLLNRQNDMLTILIISEYTRVYYNWEGDFASKLPENKFLKNWGFIDESMRYIDAEGNYIDSKGRKVDKEGYLINDENKRIDEFGNLIDDEGNLIVDKVVFLDEDGSELEQKAAEVTETKEDVVSQDSAQ